MINKCIYKNGSYTVTIDSNGSKEYFGEKFNPEFPDSLDIKITDQCNYGCSFCHESSKSSGKHGDLKNLLQKLKGLPKGIELAIGGGNPLLHPGLVEFLSELKDHFYTALTVNWNDILDPDKNMLLNEIVDNGLIRSLGISLADKDISFDEVFGKVEKIGDDVKELDLFEIIRNRSNKCNIVFHAIVGITPLSTITSLESNSFFQSHSILFLGFKSFGRAKDSILSEDIKVTWRKRILESMLRKSVYSIGITSLAFDNLALEQLSLQSFIPESLWNRHYMGNEFSHSMYVDTVRGEYGPTSRCEFSERVSWDCGSIIDYFKKEHRDHD